MSFPGHVHHDVTGEELSILGDFCEVLRLNCYMNPSSLECDECWQLDPSMLESCGVCAGG